MSFCIENQCIIFFFPKKHFPRDIVWEKWHLKNNFFSVWVTLLKKGAMFVWKEVIFSTALVYYTMSNVENSTMSNSDTHRIENSSSIFSQFK